MLRKSFLFFILFNFVNAHADDITVSAAASLKDAFTQIASSYQQRYPQDKIKLNTASSGALLQQMRQGAPVDVLATADVATMQKARQYQLVQPATAFAQNRLVLIMPHHAEKINQINELKKMDKIAIGKPNTVPAGKYAQQFLQKSHLYHSLNGKFIYTQNVRQALDYVVRGEVGAGFVYQTDARLKPVQLISYLDTEPIIYPISVSQKSLHPASASRFVQYVLSSEGQSILQRYGFLKP